MVKLGITKPDSVVICLDKSVGSANRKDEQSWIDHLLVSPGRLTDRLVNLSSSSSGVSVRTFPPKLYTCLMALI